jgi:flagellar protein FliS
MRLLSNPQEAYRNVEFDARVESASPGQLVQLCYEQLVSALGSAMHAHSKGDNLVKSRSLTRALSALTALQMGISGEDSVSGALRHFYNAARKTVLDCVLDFDANAVTRLREDFAEIALAMKQAQ